MSDTITFRCIHSHLPTAWLHTYPHWLALWRAKQTDEGTTTPLACVGQLSFPSNGKC